MSTAQESNSKTSSVRDAQVPPSLLEQAINQNVNEKVKQINQYLTDPQRIAEIEALLPDFMKGQSERLAKRARLTFADKDSLQRCTPASFVKCVLQAAELGFAIDSRLCHAVPYNVKKKDANGREFWCDEAQLQVDYKGMIACAKRLKVVQDVWSRRVYENDFFLWSERNGNLLYRHTIDPYKPRGKCIGSFAVATHAAGWFRAEWMSIEEINAIRERSKSYQSAIRKGYSTPWLTDAGEMEKKTVIKRLLKTFSDDPGLIRLLEIDDQDTILDRVIETTESRPAAPRSLDDLTRKLSIDPANAVPVECGSTPTTDVAIQDDDDMRSSYEREIENCDTIAGLTAIYDRWFGPDCPIEYTPEQNTAGLKLLERRTADLREMREKKE